MNIALVTHAYSYIGGTEKYVVDLSRWLASRGHTVVVYCANTDVPLTERAGVDVVVTAHLGRRGLIGTLSWLRASRHRSRGPHDIVQGFGRTVRHDIFRAGGGVHEVWTQRRYSGWEHAMRWLSLKAWVDQWVDKAAFDNAQIVICNSKMVGAEVCRVRGVDSQRVLVVRNGVDCERFKPNEALRRQIRERLAVPKSGRIVMFVGNGFRRKGVLTAGRAFSLSCSPDDCFVVIGKESRHRWYRRQLATLVGERLRFIGPVPDTAQWLPAADAVVLPTLYDPAANVTLEALACNVPPVVSRFDGNHEIVPYPELVVERSDDANGFANALAWALAARQTETPDFRSVAQAWPVSRNGEHMETLYREIAMARLEGNACVDG